MHTAHYVADVALTLEQEHSDDQAEMSPLCADKLCNKCTLATNGSIQAFEKRPDLTHLLHHVAGPKLRGSRTSLTSHYEGIKRELPTERSYHAKEEQHNRLDKT